MNPALTIAQLNSATGIPQRTLRRTFMGLGQKSTSAHKRTIPISQAIAHFVRSETEEGQRAAAILIKQFPAPAASAMASAPSAGVVDSRAAGAADLTEWERAWADAKAEIVLAFRDFHRESDLSLEVAAGEFARLYNDQQIRLSESTRSRKGLVSAGRLLCDERRFRASGAAGLIPHYGNRLATGIIDTTSEFSEFILAMISGNPLIRSRHVFENMCEELPGRRIPSDSTVRAYIRQWKRKNPALFERLRNPDSYKKIPRLTRRRRRRYHSR